MIRLYPQEEFREVKIEFPTVYRYAISNRARIIGFTNSIEDGKLLNGSYSQGYKTLRFNTKNSEGKWVGKTLFVYKLVAELFVPKPSEESIYVIHLDYSRDNDMVSNLRWATKEEAQEHRRKNPNVINIGAKVRAYKLQADGRKLTSTKVMHLKKLLNDPDRKTRIKMLAKQFGISEMQISRIRRGENWGHIKV